MMITLQNLTVAQLRRVVEIKEQIQDLEAQLAAIGGDTVPSAGKGKRHMSAEARARIAAAQTARWAKLKGGASSKAKAPKTGTRRKMSAATKAKIAAVARARWAEAKAAGKSGL